MREDKTQKEETTNQTTDKELILDDNWANCWICEDIFRRRRQTKRYCYFCERGFCEGEHGNFSTKRVARCIICGSQQT